MRPTDVHSTAYFAVNSTRVDEKCTTNKLKSQKQQQAKKKKKKETQKRKCKNNPNSHKAYYCFCLKKLISDMATVVQLNKIQYNFFFYWEKQNTI